MARLPPWRFKSSLTPYRRMEMTIKPQDAYEFIAALIGRDFTYDDNRIVITFKNQQEAMDTASKARIALAVWDKAIND